MKVWLFEISDFLPGIDGANRMYRAGYLFEALMRLGHDVLWWSSTFNHQRRIQRYQESTTVSAGGNCRIRLLHGPGYKRSVSLKRVFHNRAVANAFRIESLRVANNDIPELIYSCLPTLEVSEQAVVFGLKHNIPVVIDIRELWPDNYVTPFPRVMQGLVKFALQTEYKRANRLLKSATAITATSQAYLNWGLSRGAREQSAMDRWFPLGCCLSSGSDILSRFADEKRFPGGLVLKKDSFVVTFVGSFSRLFDFDTIISAAALLIESDHENIHFLLVGDGERLEWVKKRSSGLQNVHMLGWRQKLEIERILSLSSVGLAPYAFNFEPTLPNKPFEYMAAGKPILSSLGGELQEIISLQKVGLQYHSRDPIDLMKKTVYLASNPDEVERMGRRAKDLFERSFSAEIVYKEMVTHLEMIARTKGRTHNGA